MYANGVGGNACRGFPAVALCGVAAVAIAAAKLLQLVVQIPHAFFRLRFSLSPFAAPLLLPFLLLLVCPACPVSVSVRPGRLSASGTTRDTGHHSRFVPFALLLAAAARGIGVDGASCGKPVRRDEPLTQDSEGHLFGASCTEPAGSRHEGGLHCASEDDDGSESPSLRRVTCASHQQIVDGWSIVRVVTTGSRRGSDDALGADSLPQLR